MSAPTRVHIVQEMPIPGFNGEVVGVYVDYRDAARAMERHRTAVVCLEAPFHPKLALTSETETP